MKQIKFFLILSLLFLVFCGCSKNYNYADEDEQVSNEMDLSGYNRDYQKHQDH